MQGNCLKLQRLAQNIGIKPQMYLYYAMNNVEWYIHYTLVFLQLQIQIPIQSIMDGAVQSTCVAKLSSNFQRASNSENQNSTDNCKSQLFLDNKEIINKVQLALLDHIYMVCTKSNFIQITSVLLGILSAYQLLIWFCPIRSLFQSKENVTL